MSSAIQTLLNAVAVTGAGGQFDLSALPRYQGGAHSFEVSGTFVGSVVIQGSIDDGVTWHNLKTFIDAGGLYSDTGVFTHIRGNVTVYTSGSITLKARYGLLEDLKNDITTLLSRLSSARATLLDNLTRLDANISGISATSQIENLIKQLRKER